MMWKKNVIDFFDRCAPDWDFWMDTNEEVVDRILNLANVGAESVVLDVACGTGVLFPHYLERNVKAVTGIDISLEMCRIARDKFADNKKIRIVCTDAESYVPEMQFDLIMVYNALPHFAVPEILVEHLASLLKEGGRLMIAHGASREVIDQGHQGTAGKVSMGLLPADELAKIISGYLETERVISDDHMYVVSAVKRGVVL